MHSLHYPLNRLVATLIFPRADFFLCFNLPSRSSNTMYVSWSILQIIFLLLTCKLSLSHSFRYFYFIWSVYLIEWNKVSDIPCSILYLCRGNPGLSLRIRTCFDTLQWGYSWKIIFHFWILLNNRIRSLKLLITFNEGRQRLSWDILIESFFHH